MKIAVLSGKGGTGKTTVAASLAASLPRCRYIDCDVEEPNGALFLRPVLTRTTPVRVMVPSVDAGRCTGCGDCARACRFHALASVGGRVLLFAEICHHCGACLLACPHDALGEAVREIGVIESDEEELFIQGRLHVGEPVSVPILTALKARIPGDIPAVLDCPPGASCAVVRSVEGCDVCLLVTEPTPFGLHDLQIAVEVVRAMGIPLFVMVNKAMDGHDEVARFCHGSGIPVLLEIPYSLEIARDYSRGQLPVHADDRWKQAFRELYDELERRVGP